MRFKNESEENVKYRLGNRKGFDWYTIRPGETADIPEHLGNNLPLIPIKEQEVVDDEPAKEDPKDVEVDSGDEEQPFLESLVKIKGVGKKTAEDIIKVYPTKAALIETLEKGLDIPIRDDIAELVYKAFFKKELR